MVTERLRLRPFPGARFRGTKNRFDDRHVLDRVREWNGHWSAFPHGSGKDIALNRVLVAGRKSFYRDAATQEIPPVVDENSAGPVIGRIKGDFDFDAAFRPQHLHALIRDKLRAAGKRRVPRRELEHGRGQPVHLERWGLSPAALDTRNGSSPNRKREVLMG